MKKWIGFLLALILLASCAAAGAEEKWMVFHCAEDGFSTSKPLHALTEYKNSKGYVGITFYLGIPGAPPYVLVHRRPAEAKFKNPSNYLNNTYREFLEDKYASTGVAFNPSKTWEVGGKQLTGAKYNIGGTIQLQLIERRELGDVEYTAMYDPADEDAVMKALNAAVAGYIEDEAADAGTDTLDGAEDSTGDEDWEKAFAEAWAEERKAAREFTAAFTAKLTDEDLLAFVMYYGDEYRYVLGKTTLREMTEDGWIPYMEDIGVFSLCDRNEDPTGVLLYTEHGTMDEPVIAMDARFQEFMQVTYCGFDGTVGIHADDPDEYWYPDETGLELGELLSETGERIDLWDGLVNWLVTDFGAEQSEDGIYEAKIPLTDGRTLYVSSHDSQVRISLAGF